MSNSEPQQFDFISWSVDGKPVSGIEILVQMATKNEIDPKNIDVVDVTDRFLKTIAAAPKENLRQSGRILFHASVLLRMKAEALLAFDDDIGVFSDDFLEFDADGNPIIYDSKDQPVPRQISLKDLERALVRRSYSKTLRHRPVTLEELLDALRSAEKVEYNRAHKIVEPKIDLEGYHQIEDVEDILDLATEEDIETVIQQVEEILSSNFQADDVISLTRLVQCLRIPGKRSHWVDAFLAILFLANAGKVELIQEEFYGPLFLSGAVPQSVSVEVTA